MKSGIIMGGSFAHLIPYPFKTEQSSPHNPVQKISLIVIFSFFFSLLNILPLYSQISKSENLKVGILPIANRTKLAYIDTLTTTVEDNILFTANQLGRYAIVDGRSEKLSNPKQIARLKKIAKNKKCHYLIAGQVTQEQGVYILTLILYDARALGGKGEIKAIQEAPFYRMIEVFTISDRLSITLLEQLTGERIKRGIIYFVNQTPGKKFSITVNHRKLEENAPSVTLIEGTYTIKIYNTTKGRKKILTQKIDVKEGVPVRMELDLSQKIASYDKKNTIRTNPYGMIMFFGGKQFDGSTDEISGGGFMMPAFSYTRLFSDKAGINIGATCLISPGDDYNRLSVGFEIKAGPYFRIGRIGLTPMIGIGILFDSSESDYTLLDFINSENTEEYASLMWIGEILLGFEFFITPKFSIYLDLGLAVANRDEINFYNNEAQYSQETIVGFSTAIGLGLSF